MTGQSAAAELCKRQVAVVADIRPHPAQEENASLNEIPSHSRGIGRATVGALVSTP